MVSKDGMYRAFKWVTLLAVVALAYWLGEWSTPDSSAVRPIGIEPYLLSAGIGALTGIVELLQRYSRGTSVASLLGSAWSLLYLAVNICVAGLAFMMISIDGIPGIHLAVGTLGEQLRAASFSGLAGMVFLRSALASIKSGDREYPIGFGLLLDVLREQIDHRLDQSRALFCSDEVFQIMENVDAEKAARSIAPLALQMLERTSEGTQNDVRGEIDAILRSQAPNKTKAFLIGIALQKICGIKVLQRAAKALESETILQVQPDPGQGRILGSWDIIQKELSVERDRLSKP